MPTLILELCENFLKTNHANCDARSHPPAAEPPVPVSKVAPAATTSAAPRELNADSSSIEVFAVQVLKVVVICVSCLLFKKVSINTGT